MIIRPPKMRKKNDFIDCGHQTCNLEKYGETVTIPLQIEYVGDERRIDNCTNGEDCTSGSDIVGTGK